jgi:hypothetical protein
VVQLRLLLHTQLILFLRAGDKLIVTGPAPQLAGMIQLLFDLLSLGGISHTPA